MIPTGLSQSFVLFISFICWCESGCSRVDATGLKTKALTARIVHERSSSMGRNLQCTFNEKSVKAVNFLHPCCWDCGGDVGNQAEKLTQICKRLEVNALVSFLDIWVVLVTCPEKQDVVIRFLLCSSVSLKVKPLTEFNVAQKQIGEFTHAWMNKLNKNGAEVTSVCLLQVYMKLLWSMKMMKTDLLLMS